MSVQVQGADIGLSTVMARMSVAAVPFKKIFDVTPVFNQFSAEGRRYISMQHMITGISDGIVIAKTTAIRLSLVSRSMIMNGKPNTVKFDRIENHLKNHVRNVISLSEALYNSPHMTDPMTGQRAAGGVSVREYYLPNRQGGRMTKRSEQGRISFYYSNGPHGNNQYYYALVVNDLSYPIVRGNYNAALQFVV
ncbi:hypothetical protein SPHINGOT1_270201 [Sphingomonas sp. T1]|uniref:hypothetical protein n=1 Tax=Sphingomonas sp. T1 TaxID=2653172 RepID=UPI0012EF2178|nr:hypothetical protein [Sphingomonas sp. T1]VXC99144.1 hypothetical protein SPHINGOT1_270201 [Sphingomonas sp. T1]